MAFCTKCGATLPPGARYCPNCGAATAVEKPAKTPIAGKATTGEATATTSTGLSTSTKLLGGLAAIAILVVAVVIWQQRDGARPVANEIAANEIAAAEPLPTPSDTPTPPPTPSPTPTPEASDATAEDVATGLAAARPAPDTVVPVTSLDAAFANDPRLSGQAIVGPLRLRGTVAEAYPEDERPSASLEGAEGTVIAYFADDQHDAVATLQSGARLGLTCDRARHQRGTTVLEGCRIS